MRHVEIKKNSLLFFCCLKRSQSEIRKKVKTKNQNLNSHTSKVQDEVLIMHCVNLAKIFYRSQKDKYNTSTAVEQTIKLTQWKPGERRHSLDYQLLDGSYRLYSHSHIKGTKE